MDRLMERLPRQGWVYAIAAALYVAVVAVFINNAQHIFPKVNGVFAAIAMLLLFVLSAAVMGLLFLGMPVWMYLEGNKAQAVRMLLTTVATFFVITIVYLFLLLVI